MILIVFASFVITTSAGFLQYPTSSAADSYYPRYNYPSYPHIGVTEKSPVVYEPVCGIYDDVLQTFNNIHEFSNAVRSMSGWQLHNYGSCALMQKPLSEEICAAFSNEFKTFSSAQALEIENISADKKWVKVSLGKCPKYSTISRRSSSQLNRFVCSVIDGKFTTSDSIAELNILLSKVSGFVKVSAGKCPMNTTLTTIITTPTSTTSFHKTTPKTNMSTKHKPTTAKPHTSKTTPTTTTQKTITPKTHTPTTPKTHTSSTPKTHEPSARITPNPNTPKTHTHTTPNTHTFTTPKTHTSTYSHTHKTHTSTTPKTHNPTTSSITTPSTTHTTQKTITPKIHTSTSSKTIMPTTTKTHTFTTAKPHKPTTASPITTPSTTHTTHKPTTPKTHTSNTPKTYKPTTASPSTTPSTPTATTKHYYTARTREHGVIRNQNSNNYNGPYVEGDFYYNHHYLAAQHY